MENKKKSPGKSHRAGISLIELFDMFPKRTICCRMVLKVSFGLMAVSARIAGLKEHAKASHKKMPYWCTDCRSYFSIKTNTPIANSKVPMQKMVHSHLPLPYQSEKACPA